jgi:putative nucleotidyltransferase with HDIG domain
MAKLTSDALAVKKDSDPFGEIRGEEVISYLKENAYQLISAEELGPYFSRLPDLPAFSCFLAVPLRTRVRVTGLVCAYLYGAGKRFHKGHSRVLSVLTDRAGMAIENARLYDQLKNVFQETIQALVTALEAKDPYTSGHTKRVTEYASMIAHGMNLPPEEIERITQAALLHDIGKIGIRVSSLNKPEELTPEEYEIFKQHTTQGRLILEPIHFLKDIIPIAESHHERIDGSGYPQGLKGNEISLGARILAVADSFDAMTSDRPYRRSLSRKKAIDELKKFTGAQFDPEVVAVFIKALKKSS